jgi:hypothetical protein
VEDLKAPLDQYVSDLEDAVQYEPIKKQAVIQDITPENPTVNQPEDHVETQVKPSETTEN